jgi:hypothetical protein
MNAMGHGVPTMIGVDHGRVGKLISELVPDYMVMGETGMHEMTQMEMPLPDNTIPMMAGDGPFGSVGMGGMFSMLKVRKDQPRGSYKDPGWYKHPPGTQAYEWKGPLAEAPRSRVTGHGSMYMDKPIDKPVQVQVRKPGKHSH